MARKLVLVVDDELPVLELLTKLINQLGHAAETARDAVEALRKVETTKFDLVLTDLHMPGMKGDELAHEIKKRTPGKPGVLITGSEPPSLSQNIGRVLLKPFSMRKLNEVIDSLT